MKVKGKTRCPNCHSEVTIILQSYRDDWGSPLPPRKILPECPCGWVVVGTNHLDHFSELKARFITKEVEWKFTPIQWEKGEHNKFAIWHSPYQE